ncbi:MAG: DUF3880 domain-containing protein, partial [Deltaproteobacteria bacterium]|nr:DUF3880 domain-containing protein [Deltaproteobacteria bacterium]
MFKKELSLESDFLDKNLKAISLANPTAANWLLSSLSLDGLGLAMAEDGGPVLIVDGATQDSRVNPRAEAQKLLESVPQVRMAPPGLWLFGLGSPVTLALAAESPFPLSVYEPDPRVALATLSLVDLSERLESGKIRIYGRLDKALGAITPGQTPLLTHQPSKRRNLADWAGLMGLLAREKFSYARLMIVPPYFGGSAPMGVFLLKAALDLGIEARLHQWPDTLSQRAQALRSDPRAQGADLMAASARDVANQASGYEPNLILCLAQAPLDAKGLALLRQAAKGAQIAFWFVEDFTRFKYVAGIAPAFDLFFHIQGQLLDEFSLGLGLSRSWYLPPAADSSVFSPLPSPGPSSGVSAALAPSDASLSPG